MSQIDYDNVSPADLELIREPRKATFKVVHKTTGTSGETPVIPAESHEPARFRRPQKLPKENRTDGMEGFIEGRGDDSGIWVLIGGDEPKNEYIEALAGDPVALKLTFEGIPETSKSSEDSGRQPVPDTAESPAPEPQTEIEEEAIDAGTNGPVADAATEQVQPSSETSESDDEQTPVEEAHEESDGGTVGEEDMSDLDEMLAGLSEPTPGSS